MKKIIGLLLSVCMLFSISTGVMAYSDVEEGTYVSEAISVLSSLNILNGFEDGEFKPESTVTRAQMAKIICKVLGYKDAGVTNTVFTDVAAEHWASGYINMAYGYGIINGYGDGTFKPEKEVAYEETIKMIICALGYAPKFADVADAYPTAYVAQAHTCGITKNANYAIGTPASRATVATLVYNALDVEKMEQITFGTEKEWAVPTYAETLLSENLNVAKAKGFVTAVGFTAEDANKLTFQVSKNGVVKQYADENKDHYTTTLGIYNTTGGTLNNLVYADNVAPIKYRSVVAYIDMSDDTEPVVLALVEQTGKNETLAITATQAEDADINFAGKKVGYYKISSDIDATQTEVKLADGFTVYVNMNADPVAETDLTAITTAYKAGKYPVVELIDNDSSVNGYEVVVITDYFSGVVSEINDRSYRVNFDATSSTRNSIVLNPTAENYTFYIADEEGNAVDFADIKEDDVLNIFESSSTNGKYYEVIVTTEKVSGSIEEDLGDDYYFINGEEYYSLVNLQVGDAGIFFVDMFGKVLDFEIGKDANRSFGVLYAAYIDTNGVDSEPKAIIYTTDGKFTTYGFAKNIYVNGDATKAYNSIAKTTIDSTFAAIGGKDQKVIMYTINGSGLISEFYYGDGINYRDENYKVKSNAGAEYSDKTLALDKIYVEKGFTFVTLADNAWQTSLDKTKFGTSTDAILVDDEHTTYDYEIVMNIKNENIAAFGVLFGCKAKIDAASPVMFVTNTGSAEDSEGSPATRITGYVNNERVSFLVNADTIIYDKDNTTIDNSISIDKGAMIQYTGAEEADAIRVLATASEVADWQDEDGAFIDSADAEDDDIAGYMYVGSLEEYKHNTVVFNDGAEFKVNSAVATAVARGTNIYVNDYIGFGIAETNQMTYEDEINDDIVAIYFFDGDAVAAYIVDGNNDTAWN